MARTFNRSERLYQVGTYGPFSIDSFTRNDTSYLELVLTQVNWPDNASPTARIQLAWDTGDTAEWVVTGVARDPQTGNPRTSVYFRFDIPVTGNVKRPVTGGSASVEVFQALRTAVTLSAV